MLIDVRTPEEYANAHHDGAVNVPLDTVETYPFEVPNDEKIVVYCQSGGRARIAQAILAERGWKNVTLLNDTGAY